MCLLFIAINSHMTAQLNYGCLRSFKQTYNKYMYWDQQTQLVMKEVEDLLTCNYRLNTSYTSDLLNPIMGFLNQVSVFINNQVCKCQNFQPQGTITLCVHWIWSKVPQSHPQQCLLLQIPLTFELQLLCFWALMSIHVRNFCVYY
jgi:hypothetical protein